MRGICESLLVEGAKELEEMVKIYEERLEKRKKISPDPDARNFIEYFSE